MTMRRGVFITGAGSGIGRASAVLFARRGWFVGLYDRDAAGLEITRTEAGAGGSVSEVLDVTDREAFTAAAERFFHAAGGRFDVLLNNAGLLRIGRFEALPVTDDDAQIDVNIRGVVHGVRAALPWLDKTPGARVVNLCSASAVYGVPEMAVYSATKFFVRGLTEALGVEFSRRGIAVCDVLPGYVATPMVANQTNHSGTIDTFGVTLTADDVAQTVWRAATGPAWRVHHYPRWSDAVLARVAPLAPDFARVIMRRMAKL